MTTTNLPIAKRAAILIEWTGPWFAVMTLLADLAAAKGLTREQVHFAVDFVLDDDAGCHLDGAMAPLHDDAAAYESDAIEPLSVLPGANTGSTR